MGAPFSSDFSMAVRPVTSFLWWVWERLLIFNLSGFFLWGQGVWLPSPFGVVAETSSPQWRFYYRHHILQLQILYLPLFKNRFFFSANILIFSFILRVFFFTSLCIDIIAAFKSLPNVANTWIISVVFPLVLHGSNRCTLCRGLCDVRYCRLWILLCSPREW